MKTWIIDLGNIDTTPGSKTPFSPDPSFSGDGNAYLTLMRWRFKNLPGFADSLTAAAKIHAVFGNTQFHGPFANEAKLILENLKNLSPSQRGASTSRSRQH